jgi:hypothetical protein
MCRWGNIVIIIVGATTQGVGLGLLKTTPPSGTVKGDIFPVSNTDVVEIVLKPINPSKLGSSTSSSTIRFS